MRSRKGHWWQHHGNKKSDSLYYLNNGNNANIDVKEEPVLGSTADDSVNTGDNFNLYMYIMLLAVSGAALFLSKKKKCKNN